MSQDTSDELQIFVKGLEGNTTVYQIHIVSLRKKYVSPVYVRKRFTWVSHFTYYEIFTAHYHDLLCVTHKYKYKKVEKKK